MWGITSGTFPLTFKETKANDGGFSSHVRKLTLDPGNHIANGLYETSRWRITALQNGYVPPLGFVLLFLTQPGISLVGMPVLWQDIRSCRWNSNARDGDEPTTSRANDGTHQLSCTAHRINGRTYVFTAKSTPPTVSSRNQGDE